MRAWRTVFLIILSVLFTLRWIGLCIGIQKKDKTPSDKD